MEAGQQDRPYSIAKNTLEVCSAVDTLADVRSPAGQRGALYSGTSHRTESSTPWTLGAHVNLVEADQSFLCQQIRVGNVILFLGAGVNQGSLNTHNGPVKKTSELEQVLREAVKVTDSDADLGQLVEEYRQGLGDAGLLRLFRDEFLDCTPSADLIALLSYAWMRIYTLNIDDAIERVPRRARTQQLITVNRNDPVEERRNFDALEVVHLNGYIGSFDQGFIFTPKQYRSAIIKTSRWYQKCAEDFYDRVFVFIGTRLQEPVFEAHIEELSRNKSQYAARSFLVTPELPSPFRCKELAEHRIQPVEGTLASFVQFLKDKIGPTLGPEVVVSAASGTPASSRSSAAVISSVSEIGTTEWLAHHRASESRKRRIARDFFNGFPSTWEMVCNSVPTKLDFHRDLREQATQFLLDASSVLVVVGQSGSGKTTSIMKAALELAIAGKTRVFWLNDDTKTDLSDVVYYIADVVGSRSGVLAIDNIVLFSDELPRLARALEATGVKVFTQCRSGDWTGRVQRFAPESATIISQAPLTDADYIRLREGLLEHAVAPAFNKLKKDEQLRALRMADRQLLVLMKEVTQQRAFEAIIEDEYKNLEYLDARAVFSLVGLASMAKSQLSLGELHSMLREYDPSLDMDDALRRLAGIVIVGGGGLHGRHEIYVRYVFDRLLDSQSLKDAIVAALRHFAMFGRPVITKLGKKKANFFKFLLNAEGLHAWFSKKKALIDAERVYSSVELEYQGDGHYWLQRALFYRRKCNHVVARDYLERSIQAYPENDFARHALAQQKLILAALSCQPTKQLELDVEEAVKELNAQVVRRQSTDEYPLVTLAMFHPEVYWRWGNIETAKRVAREYFERLEAFNRSSPKTVPVVENARSACIRLAATGNWKGPKY